MPVLMTNGVRLDKIVRYMLSSISILVIGARFGFHLLPCCAYLLALPTKLKLQHKQQLYQRISDQSIPSTNMKLTYGLATIVVTMCNISTVVDGALQGLRSYASLDEQKENDCKRNLLFEHCI